MTDRRSHDPRGTPAAASVSVAPATNGPVSFYGLEEMLLLVEPDDHVGYLNAAMGRLLGIAERRDVLGAPLARLDDGIFGAGTLQALCAAARSLGAPVEWERELPGVTAERLPAPRGVAEKVPPRLRLVAHAAGGRVQIRVQDVTQLRWLQSALSRFVSPAVVDRVLRHAGPDLLGMVRKTVTVLFADLRGFTRLVQTQPLETTQRQLGEWFSTMQRCVEDAGGIVLQLAGDEVVALFGAPGEQPDHAISGLLAARAMQVGHRGLQARWQQVGWAAPGMGVGVSTGEMAVGTLGSDRMMYYTALGNAMNLGAHLCSAAGPAEILTVPATHEAARQSLARWRGGRGGREGGVGPWPPRVPKLRFRSMGSRRFKSGLEAVEVLRVLYESAGPEDGTALPGAAARSEGTRRRTSASACGRPRGAHEK